ncbi:uncharacterized protein [Heliangelus exortis]|uniref:uncharacterized protein n=1 Tax=Heliangelus exortis TaxID=472823 RepID=UPI003A8D4E22
MYLHLVLPLTVALSMALLFPSGLCLCVQPDWVTFLREGVKQQTTGAESTLDTWPNSVGLHSPQTRVRVRRGVVPEGPKERPGGTESLASDLPGCLNQPWDYFATVDMAWLFHWVFKFVWLLCMTGMAVHLWRKVNTPQEEGRGQVAASSIGTERWEEGALRHYEFLCQLEANTILLNRCLRHFYRHCLKHHRHRTSKGKAQQKCRNRRAFHGASSLCRCSHQ